MAYRITCSTLETLLDEQGRVVSLLHRAGGYEFLSAPAPPVGLWELALIRPVAYDDPLPEVVIPTLPYPGSICGLTVSCQKSRRSSLTSWTPASSA